MFDDKSIVVAKHKNQKVREKSRSGGVFTAISDVILGQGGVVYGCILDENLKAIHICAENAEKRNYMRGSKYVQSDLGNCLSEIAMRLKNKETVLFTGTPWCATRQEDNEK